MSVTDQIRDHRSVRSFSAEPIGEDALEKILACAERASTAGSMQLYSIIVTTDPARRETLAALHLGSDVVRQAAATLTFCVDGRRMARWLEERHETARLDHMWFFFMGISDCLLAAENALLAAESLGLGGCFLGSTIVSGAMLVPFFECPREVVPTVTLALGHPAARPELGTRLPLRAVVHREKYRDTPAAELDALYADHAADTFRRFCEYPAIGAGAKAGGIEHLSSYYARFQYPGDLMEVAAAYYLGVLHHQGFLRDDQLPRYRAVREAMAAPEIAALHPFRQILFAMALVSRHADHLIARKPADAEAAIAAFLKQRDPTILDDFVQRGFFDVAVRTRVSALFTKLGELK